MRIDILTLFPEAIQPMMDASILGRAAKKGLIEIHCVQIRDFTTNKQQQVDDYPYGGGWGCVMMAQPLKACLDWVTEQAGPRRRRVIYMSPQGARFDQNHARRLVTDYDHLVLVCGHYEGVDERFIQRCCDEELSIGDFVLTGGEIPAMAIADSVCRMVPGVLSDPECYIGESHWDGLLEYPQYTRPEVWEGMPVPEVLREGKHRQIEAWRREQQLQRTMQRRPDLFAAFEPKTPEDKMTVLRLTGREPLHYDCRLATEEDMEALLAITAQAREYLRACGVDQWQDGFPNADTFRQDMAEGGCWLFTHDGDPAGVICLYETPDPYYADIDGAWLTDGAPYATIHRSAVKDAYRGRGLAMEMMQLCEDIALGRGFGSVRIDTHEDNHAMQALLKKRDYTLCGTVYLCHGSGQPLKRLAFEKVFA